jgi:integrase/recombinase XerC
VWAERYDRGLEDIFALQDEITLNVVGAIEPSLRDAEIERVKRKRPDSLDAYDLVLRAIPHVYVAMPEEAAKALPQVLSPDVCTQLLDGESAPATDDALLARDRAMFELFYSSGLRLSELTGLDLNDVNLHSGEAQVTGKGRKTRIVPVGQQARIALAAWLPQRLPLARDNTPALFISQRGTRLTPRSVQLRLNRWARQAGLNQHVHPHMLRHAFATHVLQSSADLRAVQEMLGHASISTTQVYTHLDWQHLAKIYDQAHPRARKKS